MAKKKDNKTNAEIKSQPAGKVLEKDLILLENLAKKFYENLDLPSDACKWLLDLFYCIQIFDDIADGDKVDREKLDLLIYTSFFKLPSNQFFLLNSRRLFPLLSNSILKWKASDLAEQKKEHDARSFMWRAGFYDIVLEVFCIIHGEKLALKHSDQIMKLYGENLEKYLGEFNA